MSQHQFDWHFPRAHSKKRTLFMKIRRKWDILSQQPYPGLISIPWNARRKTRFRKINTNGDICFGKWTFDFDLMMYWCLFWTFLPLSIFDEAFLEGEDRWSPLWRASQFFLFLLMFLLHLKTRNFALSSQRYAHRSETNKKCVVYIAPLLTWGL